MNDFLKVLAFSHDTEMVRKWDAFLNKVKLPLIQFDSAVDGIVAFLQPFGLIWNPRDSKWMANN